MIGWVLGEYISQLSCCWDQIPSTNYLKEDHVLVHDLLASREKHHGRKSVVEQSCSDHGGCEAEHRGRTTEEGTRDQI